MEKVREAWTDDRLDDLNRKVDQGFLAVDKRFERVERHLDRIDLDLRELRRETNARFDHLQHTMLQLGGGAVITIVVGFIGVIATQL